MSSSGFLVPPQQDRSKEKLWVETWKRLDRFLPDLRKELELDPKEDLKEEPKVEESVAGEKDAPLTPVTPSVWYRRSDFVQNSLDERVIQI